MLTPQKIQDLADPIESIYINITNELLVNIGRHISSPTWTHTAVWEIQKLSELGQLTQENAAIINKWIKKIPPEMRSTMEATRAAALDKLEAQMEKAAEQGYVTPPVADSTVQVLKDLSDQAADKLNLVNTTMLQSSLSQYQRAINLTSGIIQRSENTQSALNFGAAAMASGTLTRQQAVRKAIRQISKEGITGFYDKSGRSWSPEAYVNMVMRTTVHNTAIQATKSRMADYGTDVFQISSHAGARPRCYPYQGWFCSWNNSSGSIELGDGSTVNYRPLSDTSYGEPAGIFGINCGHYPIPIIPGLTIPHGADNIQPEEENNKAYAESQQQRALEREIRAAKRVVEMGDDSKEAKAAVTAAQKKMREFIDRTGRTRRYDRESLYGGATTAQRLNQQRRQAEPQKPTFAPAKTIEDAEKYAQRFCDTNRFGATGISYKGIDLAVANRINNTLGTLYDTYNVDKFGGVIAPAGNTKLGQIIQGATAGYSSVQNSFILNRKVMKSEKILAQEIEATQKAVSDYLAHPERYDLNKMRSAARTVFLNSRESGRATVPTTIEEVLYHEFGHSLERGLKKTPNYDALKQRMQTYAAKVSGYATTEFGEYVAESFASFMKGEDKIDPMMREAFNALRRS